MSALKDGVFRILNNFKGSKFEICGEEIRLDESLRRWNYSSEQGMFDLMKQTLKPGDGFIDIGANFGLHSLVAGKFVGAKGKIIAVEPLPKNISYLIKHKKLNNLNNCEIIEGVVSNQSESMVEFFFPDEQFIQTGGLRTGSAGDQKLLVKNLRLDEIVKGQESKFNCIKIDVEGAEMDVILGGEQFLKKHHPDLFIEIHGFALPEFGYSTDQLLQKLTSLGYLQKVINSPENRADYFQSYFSFDQNSRQ